MQRRTLVTLMLLAVVAAAFFAPLDSEAVRIHDAALERSVGAFAIAKGLNAVISLLQGTEFSATPAGVGVTFTVGEILDPMNDMVERFSWIMLASSVSLGVQKLLLSVGEITWIKLLLGGVGGVLLASVWHPPLQRRVPVGMLLRLAVVLLVLRFGAMGFVHTGNLLYDSLMRSQYDASVALLHGTQSELDAIAAQSRREAEVKEEGLLDTLSGSYDRMKRFFDVETRIAGLKAGLEKAQMEMLHLITIFVTLNLLLPLLFLWISLNLLRWAAVGRFDGDAVREWLNAGQ